MTEDEYAERMTRIDTAARLLTASLACAREEGVELDVAWSFVDSLGLNPTDVVRKMVTALGEWVGK